MIDADTQLRIVAWGQDPAGEVYALDFVGGMIHHLIPAPPPLADAPKFPRKLSETGLFASTKDYRPEAGLPGVLAAFALLVAVGFGLGWIFIVLGLVIRTPTTVMTLGFSFLFPVVFGSNIMVDPATMPNWLQAFVAVNPNVVWNPANYLKLGTQTVVPATSGNNCVVGVDMYDKYGS